MPDELGPETLEPIYGRDAVPAWILGWDLPSGGPPAGRGGPREEVDEDALRLVGGLLEQVSIPWTACEWFGWNAFRIELPQAWSDETPGPLSPQWTEARLYCQPLEVRLRRGPERLAMTLLTEEERVRSALDPLLDGAKVALSSRSEVTLKAIAGDLLLTGGALSLPGNELPPGTRGVVRYPRLLRYGRAEGAGSEGDTLAPVRMKVTRYFDDTFRLRAVRYRGLAG